jgi:hypothetical protein
MYRALKTAQNDIHTSLLKFADEIVQVVESKTSSAKPEVCCGNATDGADGGETLQSVSAAIQLLQVKQDVQYRVLTSAIQTLNETLSRLAAGGEKAQGAVAVQTATVIPSIQLAASSNDMKEVVFTSEVNISAIDVEAEVEEAEVDAEEAEVEEAEVEEAEVDAEEAEVDAEVEVEEAEVDAEVEVEEEEVEVEAEEEDGIEVEEWTYKGRLFFKDSDNKVYVNDNGEIGDAIGLYDPVKNLLKKISAN